MGAISTTINLNDGLTSVVRSMYSSMNMLVSSLSDVDVISQSCSETIIQGMARAVAELGALESQLTGAGQMAENVKQSFNWQDISTPQVFTGSGLERAEQEMTALQFSASKVIQEQNRITETAMGMSILPRNAKFEIENLNTRIGSIANTITRLEQEKNQLSELDTSGIDKYNTQIENLRNQMYKAEMAQNAINEAMQSGDLSRLSAAYSRLNNIIDSTERNIRDNSKAQDDFNEAIDKGDKNANSLLNAYAAIGLAQKGLNLAKSFVGNTFGEGFELNKIQSQFQARLGSEEGGTALFDKVQEQAKKSAFGVSELAKNTASFLSVVNKESQLDGLNSIAEKLALFDTTGQGLEGAGFSVKEALSGDIQSLAERFNMSKSLIRGMKIDELGKSGDIDGFISQFEKLLEVQKMGDGAYEQMLKDPKVQLDMFISNMKTGFATASQSALASLTPLITRFNEWFSSESATQFFQMVSNGFQGIVNVGIAVWDVLSSIGSTIAENWGSIAPIVTGLITVIGLYGAALVAYNIVQGISNFLKFVGAVAAVAQGKATAAEATATTGATKSQIAFNASLLACPLTWIVIAIIAVIAAVVAFSVATVKASGQSASALGTFCGMVNVAIQGIKNLGLTVADIALGIWEAIKAVAHNISAAFKNAISGVKAWWWDLLSDVLTVIGKICEGLNKLPFIEFDYSGVVSAADDYAAKAAEERGKDKEEYKSVKEAFDEGITTFEVFKDGWDQEAFNQGYSFGESISDKLSGVADKLSNLKEPNIDKYLSGNNLNNTNNDIGNIGNVNKVDKVGGTVDVASEDLKSLRDIAEREAINQFTTKMVVPDVKITFTGDIKETADVGVISEAVKENIISELNSGAEFAHA